MISRAMNYEKIPIKPLSQFPERQFCDKYQKIDYISRGTFG